MTPSKSTKRESLTNPPQNTEDLASAIAHLGEIKRKINQITSEAESRISLIQEKVAEEISPLADEINETLDDIHAYTLKETRRD